MTTLRPAHEPFDLPPRLRAKAVPELISADERAFDDILRALRSAVRNIEDRLARVRRAPGRSGEQALERDLEIQRLSARGRLLARFGLASQSRGGERLDRVGIPHSDVATLTINYRTPQEVMEVAAPVIRAVLPDANVPTAIRRAGLPVRHGRRGDLDAIVNEWLRAHDEGTAVVIGDESFVPTDRVRVLTPQLVKGLEFDLVLLVDPDRFGDGVTGAVDRYVAMTRATGQLVLLSP